MSHPGVANPVRNTKYMRLIVTTLILGIHFTSGVAMCVVALTHLPRVSGYALT